MSRLIAFILVALLSNAEAFKINPSLIKNLEGNNTANVIVNFVGGNTEIVNSIDLHSFESRNLRLHTLKTNLEKHAFVTQEKVQSFLNHKFIEFKSFWISNQLYIPRADTEIIKAVALFPEVGEIHEEILIPLHSPTNENFQHQRKSTKAEWGIERIQAVEAWNITRGTGVVVSHIDTGVRYTADWNCYATQLNNKKRECPHPKFSTQQRTIQRKFHSYSTHEAVRHNFRGAEYGWYDPYEGTQTPVDDDGHGTHIMGTIAGLNGIGVAPDVTWIACKGCNLTTCTEANLITCGEWILCPTKPDGSAANCSKAPALTSCSWGIGQGDSWYEGVTEAWVAGRIVPIFALGNSGPECGTTNSPGDYKRVIAVGSTHMEDIISNFSSVGPTPDQRIKPDVCAPGENILSALPDSDTAYGIKRGTSMACPHVAGVTALLLSITPDLTFEQVHEALTKGTDTNVVTQNQTCDGRPDHIFPNHQFGYGRINAFNVVQTATTMVV